LNLRDTWSTRPGRNDYGWMNIGRPVFAQVMSVGRAPQKRTEPAAEPPPNPPVAGVSTKRVPIIGIDVFESRRYPSTPELTKNGPARTLRNSLYLTARCSTARAYSPMIMMSQIAIMPLSVPSQSAAFPVKGHALRRPAVKAENDFHRSARGPVELHPGPLSQPMACGDSLVGCSTPPEQREAPVLQIPGHGAAGIV